MSENTGWTKGEWKTTEGAGVYALNRFGTNRFYCDIQAGHDGAGERTSEAELIANAQLIAQAPRMLEALKALTDWDTFRSDYALAGHAGEEPDGHPLREARKLIALVEGRDAE